MTYYTDHGRRHWPGGTDPISERWSWVLPIDPAEADDVFDDDATYPSFEGDWGNIEDFAPTSFRICEGKLQLRIAVTGGEGDPGSTIFTLPADYWLAAKMRIWATMGTDSAGIIDVNTDGTVVYVGRIVVT